jgi:hypothetical protein
MKYRIIILLYAALAMAAGCDTRPKTSPVVPATPTPEPPVWVAALNVARTRLEARGYDVSSAAALVEGMNLRIAVLPVNCTGQTGATGFFADGLLSPGQIAAAQTSFVDGRPCIQGYADVMGMDPGPVIYVKDDTVLPHEFMHVLWFFAHPNTTCQDGVGQPWQHIEHGGYCDPMAP